MKAQVVKQIPDLAIELLKIDEQNAKVDVLRLIEQYKDHPDIEFNAPNYLYTSNEIDLPNDTDFSQQ